MTDANHKVMLNHSDNTNNPFCTDCHIRNDGNTTYRIHDNALTKPYNASSETVDGRVGGMFNSSLCTTCHKQKEVHSQNDPGNNTLECASCHANASNYSSEKQIHGIRYINDSGVYSAKWDRTAAANCTTCHQGSFISLIEVNSSDTISIPKVPSPLNHSNNASAGSIWNYSLGYFGPWKNPDGNNLRACLYCHGNVPKSQTDETDINKTIHNATGLGRANLAYVGTNYVNGSINTTSYWCSNCHTQLNSNRSALVTAFQNDGFDPPVNNTGTPLGRPGYYDHTGPITGNYNDEKCYSCHKGILAQTVGMDVFIHNVAIGTGGSPDCISCHDAGQTGSSYHVNVSVMNASNAVHRLLTGQVILALMTTQLIGITEGAGHVTAMARLVQPLAQMELMIWGLTGHHHIYVQTATCPLALSTQPTSRLLIQELTLTEASWLCMSTM
jgi:hypothetical protein